MIYERIDIRATYSRWIVPTIFINTVLSTIHFYLSYCSMIQHNWKYKFTQKRKLSISFSARICKYLNLHRDYCISDWLFNDLILSQISVPAAPLPISWSTERSKWWSSLIHTSQLLKSPPSRYSHLLNFSCNIPASSSLPDRIILYALGRWRIAGRRSSRKLRPLVRYAKNKLFGRLVQGISPRLRLSAFF